MAKSQPAKKPEPSKAPAPIRVLPMELRIGDRLADERSEWQVIGRPYSTAGGQDGPRSRREREAARRDGHPDLGRV
jgi:hypothetical protein